MKMYPKMNKWYFSRQDQYRYLGLWYLLVFGHQYLTDKKISLRNNSVMSYNQVGRQPHIPNFIEKKN